MESSWDNAGRQGQTILTCDPIKILLTICHWSTETIHPSVVKKNYQRKISVLVYFLVDPLSMDEYTTQQKIRFLLNLLKILQTGGPSPWTNLKKRPFYCFCCLSLRQESLFMFCIIMISYHYSSLIVSSCRFTSNISLCTYSICKKQL